MKGNNEIDRFPLVQRQLFALLRLAIGQPMDSCLQDNEIDWPVVFEESKKHALAAVTFSGVERMPKQKMPDWRLIANWYSQSCAIRSINDRINEKVQDLMSRLERDGFDGILLKGQGMAQYYRDLSSLRTPGDIDVWVPNHSRKEILHYLRSTSIIKHMVYHNASYPIYEKTSVEVHFTPSWFWNPLRNRRFQKFCEKCAEECLANKGVIPSIATVSVPTNRFNRVFILQHIYRHLFGEGIGLKQLLDYYVVLRESSSSAVSDGSNSSWKHGKDECWGMIRCLGMSRFCAATMWIMKQVFGLCDEELLCEPDEKEGAFLLSEIMKAGNFGQYDDSNKKTSRQSAWSRFWKHLKRNSRYIKSYPGEVLWVPAWKVWHYFWRKQFN